MNNHTLLLLHGPGAAAHDIEPSCKLQCEQNGLNLMLRQADTAAQAEKVLAAEAEHADALLISPPNMQNSQEHATVCAAIASFAAPGKPLVEVHLNNIHKQSAAKVVPLQVANGDIGFVAGLGIHGFRLAIEVIAEKLQA